MPIIWKIKNKIPIFIVIIITKSYSKSLTIIKETRLSFNIHDYKLESILFIFLDYIIQNKIEAMIISSPNY
jgi:hypothetical protein